MIFYLTFLFIIRLLLSYICFSRKKVVYRSQSPRLLSLFPGCWYSVAQSCPTLCDTMDCSMPGFPVLPHLPELAQTHVHWVGDAIQPSYPLSPLLLPPSVFPSVRVFSNELALYIRWSKYWSFSFNIRASNEYSGLVPFRINWFDLLSVQETLKSLLQHHNSKASILRCSAFFMVQPSHPYMTIGKTHSFDYLDLCWQCLCFLKYCLGLS